MYSFFSIYIPFKSVNIISDRNVYNQNLTFFPFNIHIANNGVEGLKKVHLYHPDIVVTDQMMPEMDGLTLCRKIRQNVNINYLPIILLTARTSEEDNLEGLDTGADAYLMKPFSIELLRKTVLNLIRRREQLRNAFSGRQNQEEQISIPEVKSPDDRLMERVMRVINENLGNPALTVEMISTEVGISRVHLHRKLKELTMRTTFVRVTQQLNEIFGKS